MFSNLLNLFKRRQKHVYCKRIKNFVTKNSELCLHIEQQIYEMCKLIEKLRRHCKYSSVGCKQNVLHYIVRKVFWSDFSQSLYIFKLLHYLYRVEICFELILRPAIAINYQATIDPSFSLISTRYFLEHTNLMRFELNGSRFADVPVKLQTEMHPCEAAVRLGSPELLHMLLQYGALAIDSNEPSTHYMVYTNYIRRAIIDIVYSIQELRQSFPRTAISQKNSQKYTTIVSCGKLLARVCPQLESLSSEMQEADFMRSVPDLRSVAANDIPELEFRIFSPMSLKHACRLKIRKKLYDKWQLPHGIEKLPIPHTLKDFLNLYTD